MKILIVEDEIPAQKHLSKLLYQIRPNIEILAIIENIEDGIKWLNNHPAPDVILMDIHISDGESFTILEETNTYVPVIFTTAYDEYLMKAFKVNSIDYLLKPIKKRDVEQALRKFDKIHATNAFSALDIHHFKTVLGKKNIEYKTKFLVKKGDKIIPIEYREVSSFYLNRGVVHCFVRNGSTHITDFTLDTLEGLLDNALFFRSNRQTIINIQAIEQISKYAKGKLYVEIKGFVQNPIIISAEKSPLFKEWLTT